MQTEALIRIIVSIFAALIPIIIWGYLFYQKNPESRQWTFITFFGGMVAVIPILLYKYSWQYFPSLNAFDYFKTFETNILDFTFVVLPISVLLTFMLVGVFEEYFKHIVVRIIDHGRFRTIDDAIEFSIIAALGFAYIENILYFTSIWESQGTESFIISVIFRSIFSTFAHILFSGIYGYYYGIAYFSDQVFQEEIRRNRFILLRILHRISHFRLPTLFHEEKVLEGLLLAIITHAFFNILLEMSWTIFIVPYLLFGFVTLSYLFDKKENHKNYGRLIEKEAAEPEKI
ncbi:PrsW family intramembrane metalloprotease [Candidatus Peregrinibacteria bacterium]|nr:PrsW family intramembrane metalloprotease [Candidatus Peregrinibacteria bacterium]